MNRKEELEILINSIVKTLEDNLKISSYTNVKSSYIIEAGKLIEQYINEYKELKNEQ